MSYADEKFAVIAIDGPAASGKSAVAQELARRTASYYVNTGNMYRAVTGEAIKNGFCEPLNAKKIIEMLDSLDIDYVPDEKNDLVLTVNGKPAGSEIRSPETAKYVSSVSAIPEVREWLVKKQRSMAKLGKIVMEGRDIGTVVFPQAKYKFFLTASPEVRAKRRLAQKGETLDGATVESVAKEIAKRDEMDSQRAIAPLRKADDAILIDSSELTIDEVVSKIISHIEGEK